MKKKKVDSRLINQDLLQKIFKIKSEKKLKFNFIQFSTDQMYNNLNNTEKSKIVLLNNYTRQKINSEKICKKNNALILRINFFDYNPRNFFGWLIKSINKKEKIFLFNNIKFSPLRSKTIAIIVLKIIKSKKYFISGIFNLGSRGGITKAEFGKYVFKYLKKYNLYSITNSNKFFKIKRPENMIMNSNKFTKRFKIKLPTTKEEIKDELKQNIKTKIQS